MFDFDTGYVRKRTLSNPIGFLVFEVKLARYKIVILS
jgi:hypothetical protein